MSQGITPDIIISISAGIDHDEWHKAWERHRATAEIRKANGIEGWNNDMPNWYDYCKDDTRRFYYAAKGLLK